MPVFKKEDLLQRKNYRPVSILTIISKVFEKLIAKQLTVFQNMILNSNVSAFRSKYSCQSVLFDVTEQWKMALDNNKYIGTVLMDLSKAFDCIPHALLLSKLYAYGMDTTSVSFLASYLSERLQRVRVGSAYSDWLGLIKGVPQGSVLGPSLFNIFINDLYGFITRGKLFNYADDNTISYIGDNLDQVKSALVEQSRNAIEWFNFNLMEANPGKFQLMFMHRSKTISDTIEVNGTNIQSEPCVKLLGVHIDSNLNFDTHVKHICKKSSAQLNALFRISKYLDSASKLSIIRSFIRSNFNYCSLIWHFCSTKNKHKLESILKRGLRCALDDKTSGYEELLRKANMSSLETERLKIIIFEVFKILHLQSPSYLSDYISLNDNVYNTRQHLRLPRVLTTKFGQNSIRYLAPKLWNSLSKHIWESVTMKALKNNLSEWSGPVCQLMPSL